MERLPGLVPSEGAGPNPPPRSTSGLLGYDGVPTDSFQGTDLAGWPVPEDTPAPPHPAKVLPIRVLHVINGEHYAGAERVQDLLALHLPDSGFEVGFAVLKPGAFLSRRRCRQVPVWELRMRHRLDIRPAWRLAWLIRRGGYRLLHAHTPRSLLIGRLAAWLAGVPLVYHVHSPAWADSTRWFFNWANAVLERLLLRRADRIICVSQALADQMHRQGLQTAKITVVPNGTPQPTALWKPGVCFQTPLVRKEALLSEGSSPGTGGLTRPEAASGRDAIGLDQFGGTVGMRRGASGASERCWRSATETDHRTVRMKEGISGASERAGLDRDGWTLGTVALFRPRKGIEVLLEALALLAERGVPVRLRAVGPFETDFYQAAVQQKAAQLGVADRVQWTGPVENVEAELLQMDIFVLPSLFGEGLPMVLLEAMAVGMPIVASRIPGLEEVIRPGQEGLLVEPGSPHALAQAIAHLMSHPEEAIRLAQQARLRHQQCYSAQAMAAGVGQVYRHLLANRFPPR